MSNKRITQLNTNTSPTLSDVFPIVNNNITKKLSLEGLITFVTPYLSGSTNNGGVGITGGTYNNNSGILILTNSTGGTISVTGFTTGSTEVFVTGGTYSNGTAVFRNNTGGTFSVTGFSTVTNIAYSGLVNSITSSGLTAGSYYLITDFRTCYDQPDFNSNKNEIIGNNYKQADIDPILVFATSVSTISVDAYQPNYPKDKIKYDWTYSTTERTNGVAYGRITERIDEYNNRTDYDHRTILFKRYEYIELPMSQPQTGIVNVSPTSATEMTVTGTNTLFNDLSVGQYIGFQNDDFRAYEIVSISGNTEMYITGLTNTNLGGVSYYIGSVLSDTSYYQNNITTAYTEYYTFDYNNFNVNNYVGDYANSYYYDENSFMLANNVFKGFTFRNNTFGDMCYNNTFDDDCENNTIGNYFCNNITDDDFDGNTIGNWFHDNKITSNFQYNRIGENFQFNYLVQNSFYRNNIMNYFESNIIDGNDFQNNEVGSQFGSNILLSGQFYKNDIGNGFNGNKFYSNVYGNLIGNGFNSNDIYCELYNNTINEYFINNNLGDPLNLGSYFFGYNNIMSYFQNNTCLGDFSYNTIGSYFENNTIRDGFGFGYNTSQGNIIGNYFYNNTIGEYFYNNIIADGFYNNEAYDYFQMNNVKTALFSTDFTQYYTNITAFTYTANGSTASDNTYNALTGSTNNIGINATFNVDVSGGIVTAVNINNVGKYYAVDDFITILGSQIGGTDGDDNIVITITGVSPIPTVYEQYNCEIFKNAANNNRLSYYDGDDILTIKDIDN